MSRTKTQLAQAAKARATRTRVIGAAAALFVRDGYLQTTMADIAAAAGVAVRTVYGVGSKVEVLAAALDIAIVGDDQPVPVLQRAWFHRLAAEPDGVTALGIFRDAASRVIERVYPLYAATRDGSTDPELAQVLHRNKHQRFTTHTHVARALATKTGFDTRVPVQRAAHVIYTVMSQETYGLLVTEHGWSVTDWADWAHQHLLAELFPTPNQVWPRQRGRSQ